MNIKDIENFKIKYNINCSFNLKYHNKFNFIFKRWYPNNNLYIICYFKKIKIRILGLCLYIEDNDIICDSYDDNFSLNRFEFKLNLDDIFEYKFNFYNDLDKAKNKFKTIYLLK